MKPREWQNLDIGTLAPLSAYDVLQRFKDQWRDYLSVSPALELDATWPSIGVIDRLTYSLRRKKDVPNELQLLLSGCSAYLADLARQCWAPVVGEVEISNGEKGIRITARGGRLIPEGDSVVVEVEQLFRRRLAELPFPFPVVGSFEVPIVFDSEIASKFAVGLATGLMPGLEGPWQHFAAEDLQPCVDSAKRVLAQQCAERYAKLHPKEPLGQVAELYLNDLIYPPPMMNEALPLLGAAARLADYCREYRVSADAVARLGANLARSADDTLSCMGLAIYGALGKMPVPAEVLAAALPRGNYMGFLRGAMLAVRRGFGGESDWIVSGIGSGDLAERFEVEQAMGFLPWLYLPRERLHADAEEKKLCPMLAAMCNFDLEESKKELDKLIVQDPGDIALRTQRCKLEMAGGDIPAAEKMFHLLLSEPQSDSYPPFFNLWGMCLLRLEKVEQAARYFKAALALKFPDTALRSEIENNLAWCQMLLGDYGPALTLLESAVSSSPCPVTPLLNQCSIIWNMQNFEHYYALRHRLFSLAPLDRRVFASLTANELLVENLLQ